MYACICHFRDLFWLFFELIYFNYIFCFFEHSEPKKVRNIIWIFIVDVFVHQMNASEQ